MRDGENGFLFDVEKEASLVDKALLFCHDKDLLDSMGGSSLDFAKNNLSMAKMVSSYEELYMQSVKNCFNIL